MAELETNSIPSHGPVERPLETPEKPSEAKIDEKTDSGKSEPTPAELIALKRPPYIVDLLEAHEAYETFDFKDQALEIDTFIQSEMERNGLEGREGYDKVLKGLWKQIKPSDSVYTNTEQLRDYVKIQQKLIDALEEKKKFEEMDPEDMNSKQLERYLRNHVGKY